MAPAYSHLAQLGISASSPVDARFDFRSEDLKLQEEFMQLDGMRGTLSRSSERNRQGIRRVSGPIRLQPTAVEWARLLPWILGTPASGNIYALAESLPSRYVVVDRVTKVFTYEGVKVNRATIKASQGQPLDLELDLIGVDESPGNAGTFPALDLDTSTQPFVFHDLTFTIAGGAVKAKEVTIVIDNKLDGDRFFNSPTLNSAFNATDRNISLQTSLPYGDHSALYGTGPGGVSATANFVNGGTSLLWEFIRVAFPRQSPGTPERQEIMLPLQGQALTLGSEKELKVTLDSAA